MKNDRADRLIKAIKANPRGSYREWMGAACFSSTSVVGTLLTRLAAEGKVRLDPGKARSVELVGEDAPDAVEHWKERALRAERFAVAWKASAKGWRAASQIECEIELVEDAAQAARSA